jgi:hypothetical protein
MDKLMKDSREEGGPHKWLAWRGELVQRHVKRIHAAYQWED